MHSRTTERLLRLLQPANLLLLPVLAAQGLRVRRTTPRLPEAARRSGVVDGSGPALRIVTFGDSVAAGVGIEDNTDALAGCLAAALATSTGRAVSWQVVARSGVSSRAALELAGQLPDADLVFVSMGINDLLEYRSLRAWERDLTALVRAVPSGGVVLCGMPPLARFPSLPQPLRGVFAARARLMDRVMGRIAGCLHFPVPSAQVTADFFATDRFHPSSHGCRELATGLTRVTVAKYLSL